MTNVLLARRTSAAAPKRQRTATGSFRHAEKSEAEDQASSSSDGLDLAARALVSLSEDDPALPMHVAICSLLSSHENYYVHLSYGCPSSVFFLELHNTLAITNLLLKNLPIFSCTRHPTICNDRPASRQ